MALKAPFPEPPGDLNKRELKLEELRGSLYRIHLLEHEAIYFRTKPASPKDPGCRFDDPARSFGVLYGAIKKDGAFAEVFLRELSSRLIDLDEVVVRGISELHSSPLHCVDLTGESLRVLGCDNRIATEIDYRRTQNWSKALHDHPLKPDGLIYLSRHDPRFKCVAVFDRARKKIRTRHPVELVSCMDWIAGRMEAYQLGASP